MTDKFYENEERKNMWNIKNNVYSTSISELWDLTNCTVDLGDSHNVSNPSFLHHSRFKTTITDPFTYVISAVNSHVARP